VITAVTDDATLAHDPEGEVWVGVPIEGTESSGRVTAIRAALAGRPVMNPTPHPVSALASVHDPSLIGFLETAWDRWSESGYPSDPGQSKVVPYVFPAVTGVSGRHPRSIGALAGLYAMDTMTLLGSGSWRAIKAAADCALTAADRVEDEPMYALCRPPGHHAGRAFYGGSCYLNNAALAAQRLVDRGLGPVTVIDVDAHHGNGTQEIFYHRDDVRYASVHVDPGQGWFPHFVGFADEPATVRGLAPTSTSRSHRAAGTARGSTPSPGCAISPPVRRPWSSRWGSTPPPTTRNLPSRSPPRVTAGRGGWWVNSACRR
jgi:acetoin utilization deacetylase AcuC-like enzyme